MIHSMSSHLLDIHALFEILAHFFQTDYMEGLV